MAIKSGFFNSVGGDRKYTAADIGNYLMGIVSSGVYADDSTSLQVLANGGLNVQVQVGRAMLHYHYMENDSPLVLTLDAGGSMDRTDAIVARLDLINRRCEIAVKKGTEGGGAKAPAMTRSDTVKEYMLASVYVKRLSAAITQANITDTRANTAVCGWVTGVIDQVDTSTLFLQWRTAYDAAMAEMEGMLDAQRQTFDEWYAGLTGSFDGLPVPTPLDAGSVAVVNADGSGYELASARKVVYLTLLADGWTEQDGQYSQALTAEGIQGTDTPIADLYMDGLTAAQQEELESAWGDVVRITTETDTVTAYFSALPNVDIPIKVECAIRHTIGAQTTEGSVNELESIGAKIINGKITSIVLLGDSITDGAGGSDYNGNFAGEVSTNTAGYCWANAFKKFAEARYGVTVQNKGMYGTVMVTQKDAALDFLTRNDFVIWLTGTNDRNDPGSYKANLRTYLAAIKSKCAGMLVVSNIPATLDDETAHATTMQYMDEVVRGVTSGYLPSFSMYQEFVRYCSQHGVDLASCFADHVHPNNKGYHIMFKIMCDKLGLPLDPYTDYQYTGAWWGGTGGETGDDTGDDTSTEVLLLDSTDDYSSTPTDFVYLLEDIVPVVLMDSYDSTAKTTALSGKHISRAVLDVREAGAITFGTVDLNTVGSGSTTFVQSKQLTAASTGFVEFAVDMEIGANETLAIQSMDDAGHLGFVVMSGDLFIWQSKDFAAGAKSTDLILYGKIYARESSDSAEGD